MSEYLSLVISDEHGNVRWRVCQREAPFLLVKQGEARTVEDGKRQGLEWLREWTGGLVVDLSSEREADA